MFEPKYRRKVFYGQKEVVIGKILRQTCEWKGINIIESEVCPYHILMLVEILHKISDSGFLGYLKGKSNVLIYEQFSELKYKKVFWFNECYIDMVSKHNSSMKVYIEYFYQWFELI